MNTVALCLLAATVASAFTWLVLRFDNPSEFEIEEFKRFADALGKKK